MPTGQFVNEYRKSAVNGASPLQLVIMLYDGALRFMNLGKVAMLQRNAEDQNANLQRAQKIIVELMACLDMEQGKDISQNLFALYTYLYNELVSANIEDKPESIERCMEILSGLRESWVVLDSQLRSGEVETPIAA